MNKIVVILLFLSSCSILGNQDTYYTMKRKNIPKKKIQDGLMIVVNQLYCSKCLYGILGEEEIKSVKKTVIFDLDKLSKLNMISISREVKAKSCDLVEVLFSKNRIDFDERTPIVYVVKNNNFYQLNYDSLYDYVGNVNTPYLTTKIFGKKETF